MATISLDASISASEGPSVAIIGCGPAGMFFLRQLEKERERLLELKEKLEDAGEEISSVKNSLSGLPLPTVFEKDSKCGGLWQSKSMIPQDKTKRSNGNDNDTKTKTEGGGMYDGMWINAPKEVFEFADYTFDEHFKNPMPSYITRQQVLGYIEGATNDAIEMYTKNGSILFETEVSWIDFNETTSLFQVEYVPSDVPLSHKDTDGENYNPKYGTFDKVVFGTGHDNVPSIPKREKELLTPPQQQNSESQQHFYSFNKPVVHSSEIKSLGENVSGKKFLFIGSAYSAEDLALSFIKRGVDHIYVTTRSDNGYPLTSTASWPMNKVTLLMRTEIKEVLEDNQLRMGRRELPTPTIERIAKQFYNQSHTDFVLKDIDAVVFCTGYGIDDTILAEKLLYYAEWDNITYNADMKTNVNVSHWPNIYDPSVFDPENGLPMPSETDLNSCGFPIHDNKGELRADPERDFYDDQLGTFNHHLISNSGFFYHQHSYDTPLLNLDIQSAFILKVITGEIPTPATKEERYEARSRKIAEWLRHSTTVRYYDDSVYADALVMRYYESFGNVLADGHRPYDMAFLMFSMLNEAIQAGHPTGSFLMEVADFEDQQSSFEAANVSEKGCRDMGNYRFQGGISSKTTYAFSERGLIFMEQLQKHLAAHSELTLGSNETFRDKHYENYQSIYTGTQPVPFSKLWMEIDDILGDVGVPDGLDENAITVSEGCNDAATPKMQSCPHSEL